MTKEYIISEAERIEIIGFLDKLPGTRPITNFFDLQLPQRANVNGEAKKKDEPTPAQSDSNPEEQK